MPIYEYLCDDCGVMVEKLQHMGADAPVCCAMPMMKQVSVLLDYTTKTDRSARRRWARDWTPDSAPFSTGSLHGARY